MQPPWMTFSTRQGPRMGPRMAQTRPHVCHLCQALVQEHHSNRCASERESTGGGQLTAWESVTRGFSRPDS